MTDTSRRLQPIKTYSRLNKHPRAIDDKDNDAPIKRRRTKGYLPKSKPSPFGTLDAWLRNETPSMTTGSSSPAIEAGTFSDDVTSVRTPPSSPPALGPIASGVDDGPFLHSRATVCSEDRDSRAAPVVPKQKSSRPSLHQMQMNLGSRLQKTCRDCGMAFLRTDPEDSALHEKFHARHLFGIDLGKPFRKWADKRAVGRGKGDEVIVIVDGLNRAWEREKAREVLDVVQNELGAVAIAESGLWSSRSRNGVGEAGSRYRVYLYMSGLRCVGLCLAERINHAQAVLPTPSKEVSDANDRPLCLAEEESTAIAGISRIWTLQTFRKRGIAHSLLNCVAHSFQKGRKLAKEEIAFSPPTTSGRALAQRWFGREHGWLVYLD